ncbi:MAG: DUF2213 domain-containing protein [Patescibacteria group bacterium]|jgi:hypothetical protein
MPFTIGDVKKHKKGLTSKQEEQWVAIANSILSRCISKGGTDATCASSAIRQANGVVGNSIIVQTISNENYTIRHTTHQGKPFIIVPVIMMVEGVHRGSHGPLLHTIEDLGRFPGSWDGIPIVIDHPQDEEGNYVSANSPKIIDTRTVGRTYNTSVDGTRLRSEAWLSEDALRQISPDVLASLERNEMIEISVGVFTEDERLDTNGDWNGEEYNAIARNHRPDHLALLPGGTGACSVEDGCGIRANKKKGGSKSMDNNAVVTGMEKKRNDLGMSVSEFYAVPRDPPSESKLPIFDAAHVRNALARFNQTQGLSAEEKATARRKILSKARELNIDASSLADNMRDEEFQAFRSAKDVGLYADDLVDYADVGLMERLDALRGKIDAMDTQYSIHFLREVFDSYVVYESKLRVGGVKLYKQNYQIDDDGVVNFTGDPIEVRKKVEYVSTNSGGMHRKNSNLNITNKEVTNMTDQAKPCGQCMEKIVAIINSNKTPYTEEHRPFLLTQSEEFLNSIMPKDEPAVNTGKKEEVQTLSAEDQAALEFGKKMLKEKRQKLIKGIQDNVEKDTWTDVELNDMSETMLEKVYSSVKVKEETTSMDWSLNGNSILNNSKEDEDLLLLPTGFAVNKEEKGGK